MEAHLPLLLSSGLILLLLFTAGYVSLRFKIPGLSSISSQGLRLAGGSPNTKCFTLPVKLELYFSSICSGWSFL